jgi:hypothetical protein
LFGEVTGPDEIDAVLARAKKDGSGGIIVPPDGRTYLHRGPLAQLALQHRLPGMYWSRDYVESGGLMAYGASLADLGRRAASFVDKILKGTKPADRPARRTTYEVRAGHQPQDRHGPRADDPALAAGASGSTQTERQKLLPAAQACRDPRIHGAENAHRFVYSERI